MPFPVRRRWIAVVALFAGPIVTVTAAPDWARETAKDILAYHSAEKEIRELALQREDFQDEINHVIRRCSIKEGILEELEIGRITLLEAAVRFRDLDRSHRMIAAQLYPPDRVGSFDEIAAITVLRHMHARYGSEGTPYAGTMSRLRNEFETAYGYRPE